MADQYYTVPDNPQYNENIRRIQNSDPVNADAVVNPVIEALMQNTAAVKKKADSAGKLASEQAIDGMDFDGSSTTEAATPSAVKQVYELAQQAMDAAGESKEPAAHKHVKADITDFPSSMTPISHAAAAATYGAGSASNYGHVRLSDSTDSDSGASGGIAATSSAVNTAIYASNLALGHNANASANGSTALGHSANAIGHQSTALGMGASAVGGSSAALGYNANAAGEYSTALGRGANASGDYSTAIGYKAATSDTNSMQLGDASGLSSITARVGITETSDARDKADISQVEDGALEFLRKIKAVRYVWNGRGMYSQLS